MMCCHFRNLHNNLPKKYTDLPDHFRSPKKYSLRHSYLHRHNLHQVPLPEHSNCYKKLFRHLAFEHINQDLHFRYW